MEYVLVWWKGKAIRGSVCRSWRNSGRISTVCLQEMIHFRVLTTRTGQTVAMLFGLRRRLDVKLWSKFVVMSSWYVI
jgi:hypothetical protein